LEWKVGVVQVLAEAAAQVAAADAGVYMVYKGRTLSRTHILQLRNISTMHMNDNNSELRNRDLHGACIKVFSRHRYALVVVERTRAKIITRTRLRAHICQVEKINTNRTGLECSKSKHCHLKGACQDSHTAIEFFLEC
jgi:hypothetical protein